MNNSNICSWVKEEQPRFKFDNVGGDVVTNAELLSIIIGSGSTQLNAVELCRELLNSCGQSLARLARMTTAELMRFEGIGKSKALSIRAAFELANRRQAEQAHDIVEFSSSLAIYEFLLPKMRDLSVEQGRALLLNQRYQLIKAIKISEGGITETAVDVRVILKEALLCNATVIAFAHNHPSGSVRPSVADDKLTRQLKKACEAVRIYLVDHVIVTDGNFYSYRDNGKL